MDHKFEAHVCLSVCTFVCLSAILLKQLSTDVDEMFDGVWRGPSNDRLEFGGYPDHDLDPGISKVFFLFITALAIDSQGYKKPS